MIVTLTPVVIRRAAVKSATTSFGSLRSVFARLGGGAAEALLSACAVEALSPARAVAVLARALLVCFAGDPACVAEELACLGRPRGGCACSSAARTRKDPVACGARDSLFCVLLHAKKSTQWRGLTCT